MNRSMLSRRIGGLAAATFVFGLTSCGLVAPEEPAPVVSQDAFVERLTEVCETDTMIPLSSLTSVEWDRVSVFPEGTSAEKFEAETGHKAQRWAAHGTVTPAEYLMVLQKDGGIVEMVVFLPGRIHGNREHPSLSYDADVLVRMTQTDHGCYGELVPLQSTEQGD